MGLLMLAVDVLVLVSSLSIFLAIRDHRRRGGLPYPPGPRPLPLIGNLFDIPKEFSWLKYTQLSRIHGDVLSFHVFGQVIVILNSLKATKDLLERRGEIYSDRPTLTILEMMEWKWVVPVARETELWRQSRKLLDRGLRPAVAAVYRPTQQSKVRVLLSNLLAYPDEWEAHLEDLSGELILAVGYGYEVKGRNDRKVIVARKLTQLGAETALPGGVLVNDLPFLRYIPEWLPWLSYKPLARYGYDLGQEVMHGPMSFVREGMANGTAQPSLALEHLQETEKLSGRERKETEEVISGALGSMYAAGTHTVRDQADICQCAGSTMSSIMSFVVAVLVRSDIQAKAQEELDAVTGRERLPTFEDRPKLPFVEAVCKEVLRWRPVTPLAIPHATTKDNIYEGFFIPKGAIVIGNVWAILHDPVMYPEPDSFKPERFLNPDGSLRDDPVLASAFGFGKRICPGRHFVDDTLFIVVASLLSVFNFKKGKDSGSDGYPYVGTGITRPHSFRCSIFPRDKAAEDLIVADALTR
ncbi:cytochrome P450 [Russula dissimulans]|nr:cytochrome P450 [Russula dissimulans]